jgi:anthranilate/para-aminobenzoate synthase component I
VFVRYFSGVNNSFWLDGSGWPVAVMGRADSSHVFHDWNSFRNRIDSLDLREERTAPWPGYRGGPVGHLAYELYRDTLHLPAGTESGEPSREPLARWLFPEGWLVFDPVKQKAFAAWEGEAPPAWLQIVINDWDVSSVSGRPDAALPPFAEWKPLLDEKAYTDRILSLQESIARGDTYEACLTHTFSAESDADPLTVFLRLRARNPAPYAAYLAFPDVRILSASPELFLEASADGVLRSRPIKGTRRRGSDAASDQALRDDLASSEKDAAENRMIVDLTRHDLARVCLPGSVEVSEFLRIEEHPAVFQLVSEVRGRLAPGMDAFDAIAACFPGGSMTGAPKERTMEILEKVEPFLRGIYSGALGYITHGGAFTLSMVIRTLENRGNQWRTGCGGAVLADSDPAAEWREATVKARSVIDAAGDATRGIDMV